MDTTNSTMVQVNFVLVKKAARNSILVTAQNTTLHSASMNDQQATIDAVLDAALNDLDDSDDDSDQEKNGTTMDRHSARTPREASESHTTAARPVMGPERPDEFEKLMEQMMQGADDANTNPEETFMRMMQQMQTQLESTDAEFDDSRSTPPAKPKTMKQSSLKNSNETNVEATISKLVQGMSMNTNRSRNSEKADNDHTNLNESTLNEDALMDGMMEQLLAKELMYEPMKQVADAFPQWLQDNRDKLSDKEYQEYVF
jgi:peroxin-19